MGISAPMGGLMTAILFSTVRDFLLSKTNNTNTTISNKAITVTKAATTVVELVGVA